MKQDVITYENSPTLQFYSGIIAFVCYVALVILIFGMFHLNIKNEKYGEMDAVQSIINLDDVIELSSVESPKDSKEQAVESKILKTQSKEPSKESKLDPIQNTQKAEPKEPPKTSQKEIISQITESKKEEKKEKDIDLADMFSNVSSQTMQEKKAQQEAAMQEEIKLRKKQLEDAKKQQAEKLAQNAAAIEQSTRALQESAKNLQENVKQAAASKVNLEKPRFKGNTQDKQKYDEWYNKIEGILMSEWRKTSRFYQASTSAKVRISIDSNGRLKYVHMIKQSQYGEYNNSVIEFLKQMEKRAFPPPPGDGYGDTIETNLELENMLRH